MTPPLVILIGFSTAGKSHYLDKIRENYPNNFVFYDSDEFVSAQYNDHIYNIFMQLGRVAAINFIEGKEREFIRFVSNESIKPMLVAAGPFLVIRDGWEDLLQKRSPIIIHLEKDAEEIYSDLLKRRKFQKQNPDIDNNHPNFGSWDENVLTFKEPDSQIYLDISQEDALSNIRGHLSRISPIYRKYRNKVYDSNVLKNDTKKSRELIELITSILSQNPN